jgi:hypothetical protein
MHCVSISSKQKSKEPQNLLHANTFWYSTTPRNGNPVNGNHLSDICLLSSRKNKLSYLGPGGLDSVFYLYCIDSRPNLELASGNCES